MARVTKSEFPAEQWNKKKLILALVVIIALAVGGSKLKSYFLNANISPDSNTKNVKGVSEVPRPTINFPSAQDIGVELESSLENIKKEIGNINVADLETSSPQIKKVLDDIKALPEVPGQQAKDVCLKLCGGL